MKVGTKAETRGNWGEVRDSFDRRANANPSNDIAAVEKLASICPRRPEC